MDSIHAAGRRAGALLDDDGMVGTDIRALSALDALIRVDPGSSVCAVQTHRVLRAHLHARVGKATLAAVCHIDPLFRTRIAGEFDHIDERRRVVCLRLIRLLDPLGYRCRVRCPAVRKSHGKTEPLAHDRPLQKNIVPEISDFSRNDFIRKLLNPFVHRPFRMVRHSCYFPEDPVADLLDPCLYTSHMLSSNHDRPHGFLCLVKNITLILCSFKHNFLFHS